MRNYDKKIQEIFKLVILRFHKKLRNSICQNNNKYKNKTRKEMKKIKIFSLKMHF